MNNLTPVTADQARQMNLDKGYTHRELKLTYDGITLSAYNGLTEHTVYMSVGPDWKFIGQHLVAHGYKVQEELGLSIKISW